MLHIPFDRAAQLFGCAADAVIVLFFMVELYGAKTDRKLQEKTIEVLEALTKAISNKAQEEIEILEEVHAELADINDRQDEISEEGQNESDTNRDHNPGQQESKH